MLSPSQAWLKYSLLALFLSIFIYTTPVLALKTEKAGNSGFLRYPDIYGGMIVFTSSGDLWLGSTEGGTAVRITAFEGEEKFAKFSPDGQWIAFTGTYYGNEDVFVIPVSGGEPQQLTFHPSRDQVVGWDEQGRIIFRSSREAPFFQWQLWTVTTDGSFPERLPYYRAADIAFEPQGEQVAIVPTFLAFHPWKRYRGGWAEKIWIGNPNTRNFNRISHTPGNESHPMWSSNGRIYFTSDSSGRTEIWSMQPDGKDLKQATHLGKYDVRFPEMDGNQIIFQYGMDLGLFNISNAEIKFLEINVPTDLYVARTKFVDPSEYITSWSLSYDGRRLITAARGEVFTLPVMAPGLIRQLTYSSNSREKHPSFIGRENEIFVISDVSGEDHLMRQTAPGGELQEIVKQPSNGWKLGAEVSPDGKWAAYCDYNFTLYLVDLTKGNQAVIDSGDWETEDYSWSPDSRYLAYSFEEANLMQSVRIYDTKTGEKQTISDPRFDTHNPAWDPEGRYLYCITNRNFNAYQDYAKGLFFYDHHGTMALFRLRKDVPSPFMARGDQPKSDEFPQQSWKDDRDDEEKDKDEEEWEPEPISIDFEDISERMEVLPEIPGNYGNLQATEKKLYFMSWERGGIYNGIDQRDYEGSYLLAFDLIKRESKQIASKVDDYKISSNRKVIVIHSNGNWYHGEAGGDDFNMDDDHRVSTEGWRLEVTPSEEWRQILHEAWRLQRDFFYDKGMHGVDWEDILAMYEPLIDRVTTRDDLRDLIREIQSELHAGHAYIGPGDEPKPETAPIGFLGADFKPDSESGYYRISTIFSPEPGTAEGTSPLMLTDPEIKNGTYLLGVNGRKTDASKNIYRLFQDQAGKEVALLINDKPTIKGAHEIIVKTLNTEYNIRYLEWVRQKREYVYQKSGGKIGYMHLPDMGGEGLSQIGRDYYPQRMIPALIIDDRFNGGGNIAEYFLRILDSDVWVVQQGRRGEIDLKPHGGYYGHIAALCNEETFSDGETFAEGFKRLKIGKLIGQRTWGGWVWISARHPLVDNAFISEPEFGGWGLDGKWLIEGHGVEPEMEVVNNPGSEMIGIDTQLDTAIEYLLRKMKDEPRELPSRPEPKTVE